jgi:diguanylate cyclase (GGDEF)-like protein
MAHAPDFMPAWQPRAAPAQAVARAMKRIRRWLNSPAAGRDVLGAYRERIMLPMATASTALLLPFGIVDFLLGKRVLAAMVAAVMVPLAIDAWALWRGRKPPISYGWMLLPIAVAIATALIEQGVHGAMWCYPAILFCYFVLPGWQATAGALGLLVLTSGLVWHMLGVPTMWRFTVTSGLSIVILNIILGVVGELQRKLYEQATTDPLTGALNRRQLATTLADAIEHSRRSNSPVSLLAFDLDHFKRINDRHGHAAGDEVLQRVVTLVRERARRIDRLFRMGGEEFSLLLPDNNVADAMRVATLLRERIQGAGWPAGVEVTVSVGVAQLHRKHDVDSWLKAADDALYKAKADGRNCVRIAARGRGVVADLADFGTTRPSELSGLTPLGG